MVVILDFETKDPFITQGMGPGWCYNDSNFKILGCGMKIDGGPTEYITNPTKIRNIAKKADILVSHSRDGQYEFGGLLSLGVDIWTKTLIDTSILSKIVDNSHERYSLDALGERYAGITKYSNDLGDCAKELGLVKRITDNSNLVALQNMDILSVTHPEVVARYCIQDVDITSAVYNHLKSMVSSDWINRISNVLKMCLQSRQQGVRFDVWHAQEISHTLQDKMKDILHKLGGIVSLSDTFNPSSARDLGAIIDQLGIEYLRTKKSGQPQITNDWLNKQNHPVLELIKDYRETRKFKEDFLDKLIAMQRGGRLHPTFTPLGAVQTGRFSSDSPNCQQIPSRNVEMKSKIRGLFVGESSLEWHKLDYSSQEPRMLLHYASRFNMRGSQSLKEQFKQNPHLDLYKYLATAAGIDRSQAKVITLAIPYGSGIGKVANELGWYDEKETGMPYLEFVDRRKEIDYFKMSWFKKTQSLVNNYNSQFPYLAEILKVGKDQVENNKYVTSLLGRKVSCNFPHKSVNYKIQSSAADQTLEAISRMWDENIPMLLTVHDEINVCGGIDIGNTVKDIMENCVDLEIPSVVELTSGHSWGDCK